MIRLEIWPDNEDMAYIYDSEGIRSTIAIVQDRHSRCSAYIEKIVVSEEIDSLINRFNYIRPCQDDSLFLLKELRLFLANPDCYHYSERISSTPKEILRFLKVTESTKNLQPVIIEEEDEEI